MQEGARPEISLVIPVYNEEENLPVLAGEPEAIPPSELAGNEKAIARRILVVDDNPDSAATLAMLLEVTGNEVDVAHDGLEAVTAAERFRPEPGGPALPVATARDEPGPLEDLQVLRDGGLAHRERGRQLGDRCLSRRQPGEDRPPRRVRERGERPVQLVGCHRGWHLNPSVI